MSEQLVKQAKGEDGPSKPYAEIDTTALGALALLSGCHGGGDDAWTSMFA